MKNIRKADTVERVKNFSKRRGTPREGSSHLGLKMAQGQVEPLNSR